MFASGLLLLTAAALVLAGAARLRTRVRRISWQLTRVAAAIGEAERAGRLRGELAE